MKYLFLLILISCKSLILRKTSLKVPFAVEKGNYKINLFSIEYPQDLEGKVKFFNDLSRLAYKIISNKNFENKKVSIMIDDSFIKDLIDIDKTSFIKDESFIINSASELKDFELEKLNKFLKNEDKNITQEILNLQIKALFKILNQDIKFKEFKMYTELDKDRLLDNIRISRSRMLKLLKQPNIEIVIKVENPYYKVEAEKDENYFSREVKLLNNNIFSSEFLNYKNFGVLVLNNIIEKNLNSILNCEIDIDLDCYILISNFKGYRHLINGKVVFFLGGNKYIGTYSDYSVELLDVKTTLEELNKLDLINDYRIKDLSNKFY